jgi:hypothetical protein
MGAGLGQAKTIRYTRPRITGGRLGEPYTEFGAVRGVVHV